MLARSTASVDAGSLRCLLTGHRRMFDSTSSAREHVRADDHSHPHRTRRNLSFLSKRPLPEHFKWRNHSVTFDSAPPSRRGYPILPRRRPGASIAGTTNTKDQGSAGTVDNPNRARMAPQDPRKGNIDRQQSEQLQTQLKDEEERHRDTQRRLDESLAAQRRIEGEMRQMEGQHNARVAGLAAEEAAKAQQELATARSEVEQGKKQLSEQQRQLSADKRALGRVQDAVRQQRERFEVQLEQAKAEQRKVLVRENEAKVNGMREAWKNLIDEDMRQQREAAEIRVKQRGSYLDYKEVWARLNGPSGALADHLESCSELCSKRFTYWEKALANFKPEKIEPWFPQRYSNVTKKLREMLVRQVRNAQQAKMAVTRISDAVREGGDEVRKTGHTSRKLTRHHRFQNDPTVHEAVSLAFEMLNEEVVNDVRDTYIEQAQQRERQMPRLPPGQRRRELEHELAMIRRRLDGVNRARAAFAKTREWKTLETLRLSSPEIQEVYLRMLEPEQSVSKGDRAYAMYQREQHQEERSFQDRSTAAEFRDNRTKLKDGVHEARHAIRKRQLLQESLGLRGGDEKHQQTLAEATHKAQEDAHSLWIHISNVASLSARSQPSSTHTTKAVPRVRKTVARDSETRQDSDVSARGQRSPEGSESVATTTGVAKRSRPHRRTRVRLAKARAKIEPSSSAKSTPDSGDPTETASSSPASLKFKPTQAKQAAHPFWPTSGWRYYAAPGSESELHGQHIDTYQLAMSASIDGGATGTLRPAPPVDLYDDPLPSSSQSSDSSYQPSDHGLTQSSQSASLASDLNETSTVDDLPQLEYNISEIDYRQAALASPNTAAAYWTHKLYKNSNGETPLVYYCTNIEQAEARAKEFLDEPVVGFDIEWEMGHSPAKSGIKKNVSLIQLAADGKIALFHLAVFKGETIEELMPASLRSILESRDVVKAGVNIQGDAARMKDCLAVEMVGIFELSHLFRVVMFSETPNQINRRPFKMASQVQEVLLLPLKKDSVRTSAWSKKLDIQQTEYAAADAYAGFRLFHALEAKRSLMDPMPPRPAFWEEHKPIQLGDGTLIQAKARNKIPSGDGRKAAEDDEEDEEFFDAVESFDEQELAGQTVVSAGVPLGGLNVSYPTLPSLDQLSSSLGSVTISDGSTRKGPTPKTPRRTGPPPSEQVEQAEQWVAQWRASRPDEYNVQAAGYQLRAYSLWHHQEIPCQDVAALLRTNPLSLSTVANYVLEAVRLERLEYDSDRIRDVLALIPPSAQQRYAKITNDIAR